MVRVRFLFVLHNHEKQTEFIEKCIHQYYGGVIILFLFVKRVSKMHILRQTKMLNCA